MNRRNRLIFVMAAAFVIIASGLSYLYFSGQGPVEPENDIAVKGVVGVIHIDGPITSAERTSAIASAINEAISNKSVEAVVLRIDSPGGLAHLVEQIYLDLQELKQKKPVVASISMALSGGYYIAVASDYIYTHPSSMVGNVGVIGTAPENLLPSEMNLESGPYKVPGFSRLLYPFNLSHAMENFAGAVEEGRGERLNITSKELRKGMIYIGVEAINVGLVDDVGSLQAAASHAASEAGLDEYKVVDIEAKATTDGLSTSANATEITWRDMTVSALNKMHPPPAIYYLYLPPEAFQMAGEPTITLNDDTGSEPAKTGKGQVIVDLSHGNRVSPWEMQLLSAELAPKGVYVGYADTWEELEPALAASSCLVIAAPTQPYSLEEYEAIRDFVDDGRMLLFFSDPASEFTDSKALLGPVNSIASRFGLTFGKGYLYNLDDYYGLYRNIYVREFADDNNITGGLDTIVMMTATRLHTTDSDAAWTSSETYASVAELPGRYAPISVITKGNGTVAAFGDITFMTEPYAYLEDNYDLIMNIVTEVSAIEITIVEEEEEEPEYNVTAPEIAPGSIKLFEETVNGEMSEVWWVKVQKNETRVERDTQVTLYYFDDEGSLIGWESPGIIVVYDGPVPDYPYPLVKGKGWTYRVGYNLTFSGFNVRGEITESGRVVDFEEVEVVKKTLMCAKVLISGTDVLDRLGDNYTYITSEYQWISTELGLVKSESTLVQFINGIIVAEEERSMILTGINMA
ncbi:MAG TPA: S49 family peptidase [Patescibacteria group bacterium]|nr:S49 family peptidase [Patescibacteria group bacterium]